MKSSLCHRSVLLILAAAWLSGCEQPAGSSLCDARPTYTPVAEWRDFEAAGVNALAASGGGLPSWELELYFDHDSIDGEPRERESRGTRCWPFADGMECEVLARWEGVIAAEWCGEELVLEIVESDWEELPPEVYGFRPG